jgi:hypothetical protein
MRRVKRELPTKPSGEVNPIYFEVEADGMDPRWFRMPNDRQVVELLQLLATFSTGSDGLSFEGSIDALAALVGAAWWDEELSLSTPKPKRGESWLDYGSEVLEEFHEEGIGGASHLAPWAAELAKKMGSVLMSPEATLGNGEPPKASQISSVST